MNKQMVSGPGGMRGWGVELSPGGDQGSLEQPCCSPRGETEARSSSVLLCPGQGMPPSQGTPDWPRSAWQRTVLGRAETWACCHVKFLPAVVEAEGGGFFFFLFPTESKGERTVGRKKVLEPSLGGLAPGLELGSWGWGGVAGREDGEVHLPPTSSRFAEKGRPPRRTPDAAFQALLAAAAASFPTSRFRCLQTFAYAVPCAWDALPFHLSIPRATLDLFFRLPGPTGLMGARVEPEDPPQ